MFELSDVLKAVGPTASIIFAAWIFMGFLQQRYDAAIDRFRAAVGDYRDGEHSPDRSANMKDQIATYRHRCALMGRATTVGLVSAIFLIATLMIGAVDAIVPRVPALAIAGMACAMIGFALVIIAAVIVIVEAAVVRRQIDSELIDIPELAEATGRSAGNVRDMARR